jgi:tRNA pseudouridine55 synthase
LATGVLPLCFGAATKFSQLHLDADKTYETTVRLGVQTSTADAEGEVVQICDVSCTVGQVVEVLDRFTGPIEQVPPMHSALKKDGKALYEYAREGLTVERASRAVTIHQLSLVEIEPQDGQRFVRMSVACSKGTYIRSLAHDFGKALGSGAYLSALCRTKSGNYSVENAFEVADLVNHIRTLKETGKMV